MGVIYKITNPKGKIYIGQTIDYERRLYSYNKYRCKSQIRLYNSLKKYGVDLHDIVILEEISDIKLNERERYWQEYYTAVETGLNCRYTKTTDKVGKLSIFTKKKLSIAMTGKKIHSEKYKQALGEQMKGSLNHFYGKTHSNEVKNKLSKINTGKILSDETKEKISTAHRGKHSMGNNQMARQIIDIETKKIYSCIKEAAKENKMSYSTLHKWLRNPDRNKSSLRYYEITG
jgi:group I intron endonuclease